jgi:hypothetical protein
VKDANATRGKLTSSAGFADNPHHMALHRLEPRHGGATPTSTRGLHPSPRGGRQVLEWIEARPIVNVRSKEAVSFFIDIIYRFGIPNTIIIDNGT